MKSIPKKYLVLFMLAMAFVFTSNASEGQISCPNNTTVAKFVTRTRIN